MSSLPPISSRNLLRQHPYREQIAVAQEDDFTSLSSPAAAPVERPRRGFIIEDTREGASDIRMAQIWRMRGGPGVLPGGVRKRKGKPVDIMKSRAEESDVLRRFYEELAGPHWNNKSRWEKLLRQLRKPDGTPIEMERLATMAPTEITHFRDAYGLRSKWVNRKMLPESLTSVIELRFPSNNMTGAVPQCLSELTHLRVLCLRENRITGEIPNFLGTTLHELRHIDMAYNQLEGRMPVFGMRFLSFLKVICLHDNRIGGEMSVLTGNLTLLETLALHNNRIAGTLPTSMTNLISLTECTFHNNRLSGPLPAAFGEKMRDLRMLTFSNNALTGRLPLEPLMSCVHLMVLQLDGNAFSIDMNAEYGTSIEDLRSYMKSRMHRACCLKL